MNIFESSNAFVKQARYLTTSLLAAIVLLSGCQPNGSLSAADDAFSDIAPTYIEGVADAPADQTIATSVTAHSCQNDLVVKAFKSKQSDRQVKGCGTIIKALPDDNKGSRHQKILIELDGVSPKQTLLLVHNIDLAPRVADVSRGTALSFYGEYVYNNKGGLVHWTHHDPAARHQGGWIESGGVRYD
ncbi:DUF3465 domain-containing protein [Psychrobacter urativorans]|uniref:DUF3465 domain-containing protein n=1 Tax=Psychrobacter urativorans TaxID=45610 RepID=UPI00191AA7FD|nr:DUF3465 domain-containing protein [Psychrobacter urativorans]